MGRGLGSRAGIVSIVAASFAIMQIAAVPPAASASSQSHDVSHQLDTFSSSFRPGMPPPAGVLLPGKSHTPSISFPNCPTYLYYWYAGPDGNSGLVLDAKGYGVPAQMIVWYFNGGANQIWCDVTGRATDPQGQTIIGQFEIAYYNNKYMCMDVSGQHFVSKNPIIAYPCTYGYNELFDITAEPVGPNTYVIATSYNPTLCLNVSGGIGVGRDIILWGCEAVNNEYFSPSSA